jgi:hypothetical protein
MHTDDDSKGERIQKSSDVLPGEAVPDLHPVTSRNFGRFFREILAAV